MTRRQRRNREAAQRRLEAKQRQEAAEIQRRLQQAMKRDIDGDLPRYMGRVTE